MNKDILDLISRIDALDEVDDEQPVAVPMGLLRDVADELTEGTPQSAAPFAMAGFVIYDPELAAFCREFVWGYPYKVNAA